MRVLFPAKRFLVVSIVALLPVCSVSSTLAANHGYRVLYNFCSQPQCGDGAQPGGVIAYPSGHNLWGVSYPGGANNSGAVFELAQKATGEYGETVIYSFCSAANCADGSLPMGSLIRDKSGNMYGETDEGRGGNRTKGRGCGDEMAVRRLLSGLPSGEVQTGGTGDCRCDRRRLERELRSGLKHEQGQHWRLFVLGLGAILPGRRIG
jgi:hypothetical protein